MINITVRAAAQIRESARHTGVGQAYLRIAARLDSKGVLEYGMGFDDRADGDLLSVAEGVNVLISPGSVELLTGATLDFVNVDDAAEPQFIFINPNDPSHKAARPEISPDARSPRRTD